ncbi:MAG: DCC1-like thiol-disulfide oxidoreductase family protein [Bacteroidota bacterium]
MIPSDKSIVIFDGYCNLCNGAVDLIIRNDPKDQFVFTANQHESGKELLVKFGKDPEEVTTIYLVEGDKIYERSNAALRIAAKMAFPFPLAGIAWIVPAFLRDPIYNFIASNRYRWMGKKDTCRMPTAAERAKFLA